MIFFGILVSFIIFSLVVLVHEYGHYKTARFFGIKVEEFGLGIPPRAKKLWKNKSGTLFSLNWIPLGGFVKIAGESEISFDYYTQKKKKLSLKKLEDSLKHHKDIFDTSGKKISKAERKFLAGRIKNFSAGENFFEKNIWQKSAVLLAGVMMNFLLAFTIFSFLFWIGIKPVGINTFIPEENSSLLIPTLEQSLELGIILEKPGTMLFPIEGSPSEKSGLQNEDVLLRVDDISFTNIVELQNYISQKKNTDLKLYIERKTACAPDDMNKRECPIIEYLEVFVTTNSEGKIGSYLAPNYILSEEFVYRFPLGESLQKGFYETYAQIRLTLSGLTVLSKNIFTPETPQDRQDALQKVSGPIGIVGLITDSITGGMILLCVISAIISVNLGVFNLLPIPALDGGRLLLLWIRTTVDSIIGKNGTSEKLENATHIIFFLLLIALSLLIAYNDIIKIISE